jgi:hypothetical protein
MAGGEEQRGGESLIGRIARLRLAAAPHGWGIAVAIGTLIVAGPLLTIVGARVIEDRVQAETMALERSPAVVATRAAEARRGVLRTLLSRPGLAATLDGIARVFPPEASLTFAERDERGVLRIEVAAPDPDRLRAALRREPATASLRDAGQRRGEGAMLVTLESAR